MTVTRVSNRRYLHTGLSKLASKLMDTSMCRSAKLNSVKVCNTVYIHALMSESSTAILISYCSTGEQICLFVFTMDSGLSFGL